MTVSSDSASVTVKPSSLGDNSYTFWAEDEFGCKHDTAINNYARANDDSECITAIHDIALNQKLLLVPNPPENYTEVKFDIQKPQKVEIILTTLDGKVISKEKYHFASGDQNQRISLDQAESGVYLVTLLGETFKSSRLLIKN